MPRDYYTEARALAAKLIEAGYDTWAEQLINAIRAGATSSEILGGLRGVLDQLLATEAGLPEDLATVAHGINVGMDRVLGPRP